MTDRFKFRVATINDDGSKTIHYADINGKPLLLNSLGDILLAGSDVIGETTVERARWSNAIDEIMFCTGFRDKNRVLIYEGDIVALDDEQNPEEKMPVSVVGDHGEVDVSAFCIPDCDITLLKWINAPSIGIYHIEIIGNVHEHAHLLEQKT